MEKFSDDLLGLKKVPSGTPNEWPFRRKQKEFNLPICEVFLDFTSTNNRATRFLDEECANFVRELPDRSPEASLVSGYESKLIYITARYRSKLFIAKFEICRCKRLL